MRVMFVTFSELFCQIQNLTSAIVFYENFNGFCVGMGTRNDFLKSKMHQLLMEIREDILYMNFLELHTVYEPWTGRGALISWQVTVLAPGLYCLCGHNGNYLRWR